MIDYAHPTRRRLRALKRIGAAAVHARTWSAGAVVPTFWWDGHPNFGDDMTPWLLPAYGVVPIHRDPASARLVGVGSVLEFMPPDFDGAIWGSGLMYGDPHPLPRAQAYAVRGELTRELIGAGKGTALGDPGLLAFRRVKRPPVRWSVGVVLHGHHRAHGEFLRLADPRAGHRLINVHQSARSAVREIAACEVVVTTSLHGLVTADAFGIPAVWTVLDPPLNGGDFKFRDYESAISPLRSRFLPFGDDVKLADLALAARAAEADLVRDRAAGLEAAAYAITDELGRRGGLPGGLASVFR